MDAIVVELTLSSQQYEQLVIVAQHRHLPINEVAQTAMNEWLESQAMLQQGRTIMRAFGQGIGQGSPPHDTARNHDRSLYTSEHE